MTMKATLILRDKTFEVKAGMTVRSTLEKIGVEPESVLATREGELLTDEEIIQDKDVIKLVSVISGGKIA
jgi:sulfur carrier protein ThiS